MYPNTPYATGLGDQPQLKHTIKFDNVSGSVKGREQDGSFKGWGPDLKALFIRASDGTITLGPSYGGVGTPIAFTVDNDEELPAIVASDPENGVKVTITSYTKTKGKDWEKSAELEISNATVVTQGKSVSATPKVKDGKAIVNLSVGTNREAVDLVQAAQAA